MTTQESSVLELSFTGTKPLPDVLAERVAEHPDETAVVSEHRSLTFRQLQAKSSALAEYLRHLGVAADDCVGLFVEPSIDLMVGAWGILSSGGAYLPLSPEYPEDRLRYMIEDSRARIILAQEGLTARLRELAPRGTTVITLRDVDAFVPVAAEDAAPRSGPHPGDLAYVIYTSGSTGRPKGVMIEHRSVVNQLRWLGRAHGIDRTKTVLQKTPMSFDAAQWEILAPACGSTVVMGGPGLYADPEGLIDTIDRNRVTTLQCVPTLLQALLDTEKLDTCGSLTQVFSGGEALSRNLALQFTQELPWCALINLYGPTECTINASSFTVDRAALGEGPQSVSIGRPVDRTVFHVLGKDLAPVSVGEIGELYIGGDQLARGYLHRPDLTADRFVDVTVAEDRLPVRLYRTGDLAQWNPDGTVQFAGRADNQVKLRGYRVELDEISLAIENHDWVRNAAVIVKKDSRTGFQNLIACVELSPKEAALMDQGDHGSHHQSKKSKLQVKAQLSNPGVRDVGTLDAGAAFDLPGREPTQEQRRQVFARKTYRFFEGGDVTGADVLQLLARQVTSTGSRDVTDLDFTEFGEILRYFGQYSSEERLLPKYGYASPGALYATQMYLELEGIGDLRPGYYYYHPVQHRLFLISERAGSGQNGVTVHFAGCRSAIEPIYKNNIQEVLEMETGHMVGLFEEILPAYGLDIRDRAYDPAVREHLRCADDDYYLGTFELVPQDGRRPDDATEVYVQTHAGKVAGVPEGQYRYEDGRLERISDELVLKKHVIAINQRVYENSSLGITVISRAREAWMHYIELGKKLQHLQMNDLGLGFMSSGYSSKTGHDLPAARRMEAVLSAAGRAGGPSYFFVGGRVSEDQQFSEGMREDSVHMRGPAEMIRDDLVSFLPDYMIPNRVVVLDRLPLSANGKIDAKALANSQEVNAELVERPFVAPRTELEKEISVIWGKTLRRETVSVQDDFFVSGGNSLTAVGIIRQLNAKFRISLPLQSILECPTVEKLAGQIDRDGSPISSRLVRLHSEGGKTPIICWPGLGGYPMNLRLLAGKVGLDRPFYGVQAHGINNGETPYSTIGEMAAADIEAIRLLQPSGPYTLWGYSFGARVAFEAAYQLEQAGERVDNLFLIAPGSPKVRAADGATYGREASYANKAFVTILFSVFTGTISGPDLDACLKAARDEETFATFISELKGIDRELAKRIIEVVRRTYEFEYTFRELAERNIEAPVAIFKAQGDDYSFIESSSGYSAEPPAVVRLGADHYSLLRDPDISELVKHVRYHLEVA